MEESYFLFEALAALIAVACVIVAFKQRNRKKENIWNLIALPFFLVAVIGIDGFLTIWSVLGYLGDVMYTLSMPN